MNNMWLLGIAMTVVLGISGCGAETCMDVENCASHEKMSHNVWYWPF